jgi:hypothetical protein
MHRMWVYQVTPSFGALAQVYSGAKESTLSWSSNDKLADSRRDRGIVEWDLATGRQTWSRVTTTNQFGDSYAIYPTRDSDVWVMDHASEDYLEFFERRELDPGVPPVECNPPNQWSVMLQIQAFVNYDSSTPDEAGATPSHFLLYPGGLGYSSDDSREMHWDFDLASSELILKVKDRAQFSTHIDVTPGATRIDAGTVIDADGKPGVWQGLIFGYSGFSPTAEPAQVLRALAECSSGRH